MASNDIEGYWWLKINGAQAFVNGALNALRAGKVAVLVVPNDLPWRDAMRFVMQSRIEKDRAKQGTEIIPQTIDVAESNIEKLSPGEFLLKQLGDDSYRPGSKHKIQEHIIREKLLENQLCWIKGLTCDCAEAWLKFAEDFHAPSKDKGMLVIELPFDADKSSYSNLQFIDLNECIRVYDVQLFLDYVLDKKEYNEKWKRYLSMLVSSVCKKDVEVANQLIQEYNPRTEEIEDALHRLATRTHFTKRGYAPDHILNIVRQNKKDEIGKLIWEAQIRVLFPLIELERHKWIERYRDEIQAVVDRETIWIIKDKEKAESANDIEIGLIHMMYTRKLLDEYTVPIREQRLQFLHDCRNNLAHLRPGKLYQISNILDKEFEDFF